MAQQQQPQLHMVTETPLQSLVRLKNIPSGISYSIPQLKLSATDLWWISMTPASHPASVPHPVCCCFVTPYCPPAITTAKGEASFVPSCPSFTY